MECLAIYKNRIGERKKCYFNGVLGTVDEAIFDIIKQEQIIDKKTKTEDITILEIHSSD